MQSMGLLRVGHDLLSEQQQEGMKEWLESLLLPFSCYSSHLPDNPMFSSVQPSEHFLCDDPCLASRETNDSISNLEAVKVRNGRASSGYTPRADRHTLGTWYREYVHGVYGIILAS